MCIRHGVEILFFFCGEVGFEKNFFPALSGVLFATPLVNTGKSYRLHFQAPAQPGDYPVICSFPGHWQVMQGIMRVMDRKEMQQGL
jgi:azurin